MATEFAMMAAMMHVSELSMNAGFAMELGERLHETVLDYVIILLSTNTVIRTTIYVRNWRQ